MKTFIAPAHFCFIGDKIVGAKNGAEMLSHQFEEQLERAKLEVETLVEVAITDSQIKSRILKCISINFAHLRISCVDRETYLDSLFDCRKSVLDLCELAVGTQNDWPMLRRRLLYSFGDRGLLKIANDNCFR